MFGENFPYTNFHDLNMDWIIKIAKDFLDQYTSIQQVISNGETSLQNLTEEGLQQLQDKADNLEALLQTWYNEHSEDIADQLADALTDLNTWYTDHVGYLDQYVTDSIADFTQRAEAKAAETIESIPPDYTSLANDVLEHHKTLDYYTISGANLWEQGSPFASTTLGRVTSIDSMENVYNVIASEDCYLYPVAVTPLKVIGYYDKATDTILPSISSATGWTTDLPLPMNEIVKKYPQYIWKVVVEKRGVSNLTPSQVADIVFNYCNTIKTIHNTQSIIEELHYDKTINLFNKNNVVEGKYITVNNGAIDNDARMFYSIVPIYDYGDYSFPVSRKFFGGNANLISLFTADDEYFARVTATLETTENTDTVIAHITIPQNYYINGARKLGISNKIYMESMIMIVHSSQYPTEYTPYLEGFTFPNLTNDKLLASSNNPLYLKKVLFDGDSIGSAMSEGGLHLGYAGRIGKQQNMQWINESASGATIATGTGASKSLVRELEDIYTRYTDIEYYIFDGGVNDADRNVTLGTFDPHDFSGTYTTTTFSGALDKLLYDVKTFFPDAKIGYIVIPKVYFNNDITAYDKRRTYFDRAIEICEKWGVPVIDLWNESTLNPFLVTDYDPTLTEQENIDALKMYVDGEHLTPTGYDRITNIITRWMMTL